MKLIKKPETGNTTGITCDECNKEASRLIEIGEVPDYGSATTYVCFMCLQKAMMLIADLVKN